MAEKVESEAKIIRTEVAFHPGETAEQSHVITIEGAHADLTRSPEKIHQLMDLLELPQGSRAVVNVIASSTIVR